MTHTRWQHPGELLAVSGGYWEPFVIHAAVDLGIFDSIESGCKTVDAMAKRIEADADLLDRLLNALAAMDLLKKRGSIYENTPISRERLCQDSDATLVDIIRHHKNLVESWSKLATKIAPAKHVDDDAELADFLLGMRNMGSMNAPTVLQHVDLSGCSKLLDLGSGPGAYSLAFCNAYPNVTATLFDRPTTRPFVEALVAEHHMTDRMVFEEGDFTCDPFGEGYDVVWASHVLHSNPTTAVQDILGRIHAALAPGGRLIIQEFILNPTCDGPLFPALFSLNMMVNDNGGKSYCVTELTDMMSAAGFVDVTMVPLPGPADLIIGTTPGDA